MKNRFLNWSELEKWLDGRGMFHMELGLGRMESAMKELLSGKLPFAACQTLGTNGKGSTCAFLDSLCREAGLDTGLYTSPHFLSPRERIRINDKMAEEAMWLDAANEIAAKVKAWEDLTYFEFITLVAMLVFRDAGVDIAVFEAGLGGKNDATTAIPVIAQCFAPVAMDHAMVIGPTIEDIARDKSAAMRPGIPVFSAPQFPAVAGILEKEAAEKGCSLEFCQSVSLPDGALLTGGYQSINMGVAVAAAGSILKKPGRSPLSEKQVANALRSAFLPGRRQFLAANEKHPSLVLDGGHNPHAVSFFARNFDRSPSVVIFSCLADKDWHPGLGLLARTFPDAGFIVPQLHNERAEDSEKVASWINSFWPGRAKFLKGENSVANALNDAMQMGSGCLALVTGSFFLLAEFYALFPQYLEKQA